jgi:hypothetical protein
MNHCYLRIRAKGFTNHGVETLLAKVHEDGIIMLFDSLCGCFTHCHNLSKNAKTKLIMAFKIARDNELRLVMKPENCYYADYVINGWKRIKECNIQKLATEEEISALDSMIYHGLDECRSKESIRKDARIWMIKRAIKLSSYDFEDRFGQIVSENNNQ